MGLAVGAEPGWQATETSDVRIVDDRVMGGVSQSAIDMESEGFTYKGLLSRDRGGGFASMRIVDDTLDVTGTEGVELVVRGDGRTYQLTARRSDVRLRAGSYRALFQAPDTWTTVRLPFSTFGAMQMGQDVVGAPSLDGDLGNVDQLGILLTDGPEGPFALEVRSLQTYGTARGRQGDAGQVKALLAAAVQKGVPRYNEGDAEGCRDIYADVLRTISARDELTDGEQLMVRQALDDAKQLDPNRGAWRLRYGIDAVMAGIMRSP